MTTTPEPTTAPDGAPEAPAPRPGRAHRFTYGALGVVGEILITLGVLLFAFLVWQLWWTDVEAERTQTQIIANLDRETPPAPTPSASSSGPVIAEPRRDEPPVLDAPPLRTTFATMLVPRWGADFERTISEGVDKETVLNPLGIGHYLDTAMPGGVGNFAVAGHRTTYGKPFNLVQELEVGDPIVVRTADTWYVYRVTSSQIVSPQDVSVVAPVPGQPGVAPVDRMITLTTCHPMFSARERFIVHGTFDYWAPVADGVPAEIVGGA